MLVTKTTLQERLKRKFQQGRMKITPSSIVHENPLRMQQEIAGVIQIRTAERTTGPLPNLQESQIA
jgi:hypothetical protein